MKLADLRDSLLDDYYNGNPCDWKSAVGYDLSGTQAFEIRFDFEDESALISDLEKDQRGLCSFQGIMTVEIGLAPHLVSVMAPFSGKISRFEGAECSWVHHQIGEFQPVSRKLATD